MTEREIERIYQEEPDEAKVLEAEKQLRAMHEGVDLAIELASRDGEDKQLICDLLCWALKATRDQHDLQALIYHKEGCDEYVDICYPKGGRNVNVTIDSGIAMIRDILRAIG